MPQLLTPAEVAKQLKVNVGTVYNWVTQKKIPYVKLMSAVRFDQAKIDNWVNQRSVRTKVGGMTV